MEIPISPFLVFSGMYYFAAAWVHGAGKMNKLGIEEVCETDFNCNFWGQKYFLSRLNLYQKVGS